jgi:transcriptional regulator with XRE-family HTH domain
MKELNIRATGAKPLSVGFDGGMVRVLRKRQSLTQKKLAERSGLSETTICLIEKGNYKNPTINAVLRLSLAMKCSCDSLCRKF